MNGNEMPSSDGSRTVETTGTSSAVPASSSSSQKTPPSVAAMTRRQKNEAVASLLRGEDPGPVGEAVPGDDGWEGAGDDDATHGPPPSQPSGGEGAGDPDAVGDGDGAGSGGGDRGGSGDALDLNGIAEKLGVDPDEVYKATITTRDGETVSIEQLKDAWQKRKSDERGIAERVSELDRREAGVIADQQVWSLLAASGQLPAEAVRTAQTQIQNIVQRESATLFDLVPELRDEAKLDLFRRDMVSALGEVGYKPHEIMLTDHRQALFVRRFVQMLRELEALRAENRPTPPKTGRPQGRQGQPGGSVKLNARASHAEKNSMVASLLRGDG